MSEKSVEQVVDMIIETMAPQPGQIMLVRFPEGADHANCIQAARELRMALHQHTGMLVPMIFTTSDVSLQLLDEDAMRSAGWVRPANYQPPAPGVAH